MVLKEGQLLRIWSRYPGLSYSEVKMQFWVRVLTVFLPEKVENFWKSRSTLSIRFSFLPSNCSSIVAVASMTWFRTGMALMMDCILGRIRSQNSRSASSSTSTQTRFISSTNLSDFQSISASLPGVATITWGQLSSWSCCERQLTPPTMSACLRFILCPKTAICWWICMASSRLGATMTAKIEVGSCASRWRSGRAKAAVFPEPVSELMMSERFSRAAGIASACMGVGVWYLILWQVVSSQSDSFSLLNDIIIILNNMQSSYHEYK